jgi:hypothetical protein
MSIFHSAHLALPLYFEVEDFEGAVWMRSRKRIVGDIYGSSYLGSAPNSQYALLDQASPTAG